MSPTGPYTAADLARLAGVSVRTVRFYVQQGLIDPPQGRGRGAHFGERQLHQLRRVRELQAAGLDNAAIRAHADELERILSERGLTLESAGRIWTSYVVADAQALIAADPPQADRDAVDDDEALLDLDTAVRIPMGPGVELLIDPNLQLPSPRRLVELAMTIRRLFQPAKERK